MSIIRLINCEKSDCGYVILQYITDTMYKLKLEETLTMYVP